MSTEKSDFIVKLPSMGEGVQEATLNKWLKKPGEKVSKDEPLLQVSTDKVDTEIMSPHSGYLIATFVEKDMVIPVGESIAQISSSKDAPILEVKRNQKDQKSAEKNFSPRSDFKGKNLSDFVATKRQFRDLPHSYAGSIKASPVVKKIAKETGVSLADLEGRGKYGRITKEDILYFLQSTSSGENKKTEDIKKNHLRLEKKDGQEYLEGVLIKREPMSKIRRLTADHMVSSVATSPHVTTTFEVSLDQVLAHKEKFAEPFKEKHNIKLTLTPYFISACVEGLKVHPHVNASIDGYDILLKEDINIACAVATEEGLLVPVLKKLQNKNFEELVIEFQELINKTRDKKLSPSDLAGGTFSVTNPGMYGSIHSQPIINQPQVAILSIGAMTKRLELQGKDIIEKTYCQLGLTFDHRIIDGQGGAFFLKTVKEYLENFLTR